MKNNSNRRRRFPRLLAAGLCLCAASCRGGPALTFSLGWENIHGSVTVDGRTHGTAEKAANPQPVTSTK